jgi:phosphoglycolate phosphatase
MPAAGSVAPVLERLAGFRPRPNARAAIFDFDGTLSLIRGRWAEIMLALFHERLPARPGEDARAHERMLLDDIWSLNGHPSLVQMERLASRISARGERAQPATVYEAEYQRRLAERIAERRRAIAAPGGDPKAFLVPGAQAMLASLARRGLTLHLVSGTMERDVRVEAAVLGIHGYFGERIHGPRAVGDGFTKAAHIQRILGEAGGSGERVIAFGDGATEIAESARMGALAIAVASDERGGGAVDAAKRELLIKHGAMAVVPHYGDGESLAEALLAGARAP